MVERKEKEVLKKQYEEQGSCCYYCEEKVPYSLITRDHINPKSKGHTFINNKVFACRACNSVKGDKSLEEFQKYMLNKACNMLRAVANQKFMASQDQVDKIKYYTKVSRKVLTILENGGKPDMIFT